MAWGFFGHRLNLYRSATPHAGFEILRRWCENAPHGYFVFTSNVDGQFQKAGFPEDRVYECHGSIHRLQCARNCGQSLWPSDELQVSVELATIRATSMLPTCPDCDGVARPNILMFGDWDWDSQHSADQSRRYARWLNENARKRIVAIEIGAGLAIPTVRLECEERADQLIRINPREAETSKAGVSIPLGAMDALQRIDEVIRP